MGQVEAVMVVGGAVVVMVGIAEEVGRTGRMAEADVEVVGLGVVVEDGEEGDRVEEMWVEVAVAITDVTAVKVDIDVAAFVFDSGGVEDGTGTIGRGDLAVEAAFGLLEGGEAVMTGWIVVMAVELTTQPILAHAYPETQHPPPALSGQLVSPLGQLATLPLQLCPSPQHPTSPCPVSGID